MQLIHIKSGTETSEYYMTIAALQFKHNKDNLLFLLAVDFNQ